MSGIIGTGPTLRMFVKYNPRLLKLSGFTGEGLVRAMRKYGSGVQVVAEAKLQLLPFEECFVKAEIKYFGYCNLLCTKG